MSQSRSTRTRTSKERLDNPEGLSPDDARELPERRIGEVLGSYRLIDLLGSGGMGWVYRAEHLKLGRQVALKLLRDDRAGRRNAVARFFNEARTVNRIRHRNIVDITDLVELESGATFIIMELLDGITLGEWMRTSHGETARILDLAVQICDGLAAAHRVGVVHRDLKPDNVIVVPGEDGTEQVKLLDFGIAKLLVDDELGPETGAGTVMGTPAYMSPEQAGGLPVDARSDIYSLGALLYEMFTGERLFQGKSLGEYVRKHLNEAPRPPRETRDGAGMDPRLEGVILRCLAKKPKARFRNVGAVRTKLAIARAACPDPDPWAQPGMRASRSSTRGIPAVHGSHTAERWRAPARLLARVAATGRRPWLLALGTAAGVTALLLIRLGLPGTPRSSVPAGGAQVAPESAASMGLPAASMPEPITIHFDSTPSAEVTLVGAADLRCRTPCDLGVPASAGSNVEIAAPGYRSVHMEIDRRDPWQVVYVRLEARERDRAPERAQEPTSDVPPRRTAPARRSRTKSDQRPARPTVRPGDTLDPFGPR